MSQRAEFVKRYVMKGIKDLPSLPTAVTRILEETQKESVSAATLESFIASDQAIAAKTLRVVNSAYYGLESQVSSLSQSVVILGIQQLRNIVLSVSAISLMRATTPRQQELQRKFWQHALGTAACAQKIATDKKFNGINRELVFVGGLLHDIGRLFLYTNMTDYFVQIERSQQKSGMSISDVELSIIGITHTEIGNELYHIWKFPENLGMFMAQHDGPFDQNTPEPLMAVHLADRVARKTLFESDVQEQLDPVALRWLGEDETYLDSLSENLKAMMHEYEEMFAIMAA